MKEETLFSYDRAIDLMDKAGVDILLVNTKTNVSHILHQNLILKF
jgi:hypothetical protein